MIYLKNSIQKGAGVAILILDSRPTKITKDGEDHYIMITSLICQKIISDVNYRKRKFYHYERNC